MRSLAISVVLLLAQTQLGCSEDGPPAEPVAAGWQPGQPVRTERAPGPRGWLDRRGIIHAHSVYSHDACDDEPRDPDSGAINQQCFEDLRDGMCQTLQDFVMLTDHDDSFAETEYPEVLQYQPNRGDELVERDGNTPASWLACDGAEPVLVMAGTETGTMPVGLEHHVGDTPEERYEAYGEVSPEAIEAFKQAGAVAMVQHTEDWSVDQLAELPLDGFEMFNLHAAFMVHLELAVVLVGDLSTDPESLPHPDLVVLPVLVDDERYLQRWGGTLARGVQRVTTMATDSHRNALPQLLPDGERIDSFRRMMSWLSNHLLVQPKADGSWDDASLKEALRAGRLWGSFDALGVPVGFDFVATADGVDHEMGDQIPLSGCVELQVQRPTLLGLEPQDAAPEITARILRAEPNGWQLVAEDQADLSVEITEPGAYRAEIRIVPRHLAPHLSSWSEWATESLVWIYANPVYLVEP